MWKLGLQIGSKLDVRDTVDRWCEATVAAVDREAATVFITYTYWAPKVCTCSNFSVPLCNTMYSVFLLVYFLRTFIYCCTEYIIPGYI